jgi:hypothetical protein
VKLESSGLSEGTQIWQRGRRCCPIHIRRNGAYPFKWSEDPIGSGWVVRVVRNHHLFTGKRRGSRPGFRFSHLGRSHIPSRWSWTTRKIVAGPFLALEEKKLPAHPESTSFQFYFSSNLLLNRFELHSRTLADPQVPASGKARHWSVFLNLSFFGTLLLGFHGAYADTIL